MICYKGKTFCSFYKDCYQASVCDRPLTPDVVEAAQNAGLDISQYAERPACWTPIDLWGTFPYNEEGSC